jgi:uncharacterized OsmC-like protein
MDDGFHHRDDEAVPGIKDGVMSNNRDQTIATATVTSEETLTYVVKDRNTRWIDRLITLHGVDEDQRAKLAEIAEKTPVTRVVRAGTEIRTTTGAR